MSIGEKARIIVSYIENRVERAIVYEKAKKALFNDSNCISVLNGPFKGMKYIDYKSAGSVLWPKLLGTYEKELYPFVESSLSNEYRYIIDIGCAEGYYAVGYALKGKYEKVIAYDIDLRARKLCREMCMLNQVKIDIRERCTKRTLESINFGTDKPSLILMDCEGYERELLSSINTEHLRNVYLLIEIHDWCQFERPTYDLILQTFKATHNCETITGLDDYDKAYKYHISEIQGLPIKYRYHLFREGRKRLGKWIILSPRRNKHI